jgi:hypothetical protein
MWRSAVIGLLVLVCPHVHTHAGEMYKSIDADGHVVYSDRADTPSAQKTEVQVVRPNPAEVARMAQVQAGANAAQLERKKQQEIDDANAKAQQEQERRMQCANAKGRYLAAKSAPRKFHYDGDGYRVGDPDPAADAALDEARMAVAAACTN